MTWPGAPDGLAGFDLLGYVDCRLGAPNPPAPTTVKAALYTGRNPLVAAGGLHRRGRPDEQLQGFLREYSLFRQHPAIYANAHRPDAFRTAPTPLMVAAEAGASAVRTLGQLRRGLALPPDISGLSYIQRGHQELVPLTGTAAAEVVMRLTSEAPVVWELDHLAEPHNILGLTNTLTANGTHWLLLNFPPEGADQWPDALPLYGWPSWTPPELVTDVLPAWWAASGGRP